MPKTARTYLAAILQALARWTLQRFQPEIIGVTGSAGKTSTKEAIAAILTSHWRVRATAANYNTEIGLPMTILGSWQKTAGAGFWLKVIVTSAFRLLLPQKLAKYPEILILEYAADRPGDIKQLLSIAKPRVSVISAIGEIPVHVEFYENIEAVTREKGRLVEVLPAAGGVVLNADDPQAMSLKTKTRARPITFGFSKEADLRITNFEVKKDARTDWPVGISFKLGYKDAFVPVRIATAIGKPQAYAAAAAAAVGITHNLNLVQIAEGLTNFKSPKRRLHLAAGLGGSLLIDDSYNSSPLAALAALDALETVDRMRKVAILADMRELGKYADVAHTKVGERAAQVADLLITIGPKAKIIADSAMRAGLDPEAIISFKDAKEAAGKIRPRIKKDDAVLIKGSLSMGLAAIVDELGVRNLR